MVKWKDVSRRLGLPAVGTVQKVHCCVASSELGNYKAGISELRGSEGLRLYAWDSEIHLQPAKGRFLAVTFNHDAKNNE